MKYLLFFTMSLIPLAAFASTKPQVQSISAQQKNMPEVAKGGAGPSGYIAPAEKKVKAEPAGVAQNGNAAMANNGAASTAAAFAAALDKKLRDLEARLYNYVDKVLPKPSEADSDDEDDDSIKATATMVKKDKDFGAAAW